MPDQLNRSGIFSIKAIHSNHLSLNSLYNVKFFPFFVLLQISISNSLFSQKTTNAEESWWNNTTIYQIYPRSFKDSNSDGIGDLRGIISKLDYIKNMGFETIWISPFYASPQSDFGYDISDYYTPAPEYGQKTTIDSLITEIHQRGMKVVFDMVLNHTSNEHPWFKESMSSKTNDKSDWYIWRDGKGKNPPNNWYDALNKKAWHYSPERNQWYYAAFLSFQPDLNYRNPEVREAMFNVVKYWLDKGVDGFRLDIFNCIMEDEKFTDNPFIFKLLPSRDGLQAKFQSKVNNINHPDNVMLAKQLRDTLEKYENPKRFVVGEAIGPLETIKPLIGEKNDGLNLIFLFDMIFFDFNATFFEKMIREFEEEFPAPFMPTIVFGNHDNLRSMARIKNSIEKARLLALFQLTARGVPVIYYGEEIGMRNVKIPKKEAKDPISYEFNYIPQFVRNMLPLAVNRDVCRTPMQWADTTFAGFSSGNTSPWLPVDEEYSIRNVKTQTADENSLLNTYKDLLKIRNKAAAFSRGTISIEALENSSKSILVYKRIFDKEEYLVIINFSDKPTSITLPEGRYFLIYSIDKQDTIDNNTAKLNCLGGMILKLDPKKQ